MHRVVTLAVGLLVGAVSPAWAQRVAELSERRDYQVVRAEAPAPDLAGPLLARLRGHERLAPSTPAVVEGGRVTVELMTSRRLLPGNYTVELVQPGREQPVLTWELRHGDPQTVEAALDRHRVWLQRATSTVRELSSSLEQRTRYHLARMRRSPDQRQVELDTFEQFFRERWRPALLGARMDMETYGRRLLLPPLPVASEELVALLDALDARVGAWQRALESADEPPPTPPELETRRRRLLETLGLPESGLAAWSAGPLAEPPPPLSPLPPSRVYEGPLGFRLVVPEGFEQAETTRPEDRFKALGPRQTTLLVQVMELPDATTFDELRAALEIANWEGFLSYKRGEVEPLTDGGGVRITFHANAADLASVEQTAAAVQIARFAPEQRRIYSLIVFHPAGSQPAGLAEAEASFALEHGR